MFVEDLSVFFSETEFAVLAIWGALQTEVIFNTPNEDILNGRAQGIAFEVLLPTAEFPLITRGESVTVAGVAYVVREVRREGDGAVKRLILASDA